MIDRGSKPNKRAHREFYGKTRRSPKALPVGENEQFAAEICDIEFEPMPAFMSAIERMPWYDLNEPWPWDIKARHNGKRNIFLRPAVINWIESTSGDKPLSHANYNSGQPSVVLAIHAMRRMLGIPWNETTRKHWMRYRAWRDQYRHWEAGILASTGAIDADDYVRRILE